MLKKIDGEILALHQWIVDTTGKPPLWLARQCALMFILITGMRFFFTDTLSPLGFIVISALGFMLALASFVPQALFRSISDWIVRMFSNAFVLFAVIAVGYAFVTNRAPAMQIDAILRLIDSTAIASYWCFAGCKPPAPRPPKKKVALGKLSHTGAL